MNKEHIWIRHSVLVLTLSSTYNLMLHLMILSSAYTEVLISPQPNLLPEVFCLMLVLLYIYLYINSNNIPPIMIINRIYETQNLLSLQLVSFLVGLRTYQHPSIYTGVLISPLFCLMVRIFHLMLALLYIQIVLIFLQL